MGRKKKVVELDKVKLGTPTEDLSFEYGDLAVTCKCGRTQILHKGIKGGLQLILTNRDDSFIQLLCDECGSDLKLCLVKGEKPVEVPKESEAEVKKEAKEDEVIPQEDKQEQSL